jgi:hypothetical protein
MDGWESAVDRVDGTAKVRASARVGGGTFAAIIMLIAAAKPALRIYSSWKAHSSNDDNASRFA